ncbi:sulfotransferase [Xanthobacter dioxanivorans]|uniref:Sulfotransferase n=1 Tax=Xanthobacter dioxanivorans TaxID=2528964 RepID=A0A974PKE0_9HYPH|nr:sulfotransferase [Xanthobacter dioxanivorans]QRG04804.1 sulfotransferase [Xanthobacter dioxanivorans]
MDVPPTPFVNFVVVGVQKAGTSALFHFLAQHPQVAMPTVKELHFFDDDRRCWDAPDYRDYHGRFPRRRGCVVGEATPSYIWWPGALARLADYNPRLKVIALFRDPVDRAHAHWRMSRARGLDALDFSTAIRAEGRRLDGLAPQAPERRHLSYVARGFYGQQVDRLYDVFPRRQVLMLRKEDLANDHAATLARVFAFLGLPPAKIEPCRIFEGAASEAPAPQDVAYLAATYAADLARFALLTGLPVSAWAGGCARGPAPADGRCG